MKATELLRNQHQQVEALFEQIEGAEGKESRALVDELATAIVGHSLIERHRLYPEAENLLGAGNEIRRAYEEHALVEHMLQKLLKTDPGDPSFHARASVLKDLFLRHVREEEEDLLARADQEIDEERLEELGEQMAAEFEKIQGQDVEALLAGELRKSTPRTTTRRPAKKAAARRGPAKQPARAKRGAAQRATPARGGAPAKAGRATGKKAAAQGREGGGRAGATRGGATQATRGGGAKGGGARGGQARKGRSSSASSR